MICFSVKFTSNQEISISVQVFAILDSRQASLDLVP